MQIGNPGGVGPAAGKLSDVVGEGRGRDQGHIHGQPRVFRRHRGADSDIAHTDGMRRGIKGHQLPAHPERQQKMRIRRRGAEPAVFLRDMRGQSGVKGQQIRQRVKRRFFAGKQCLQHGDQKRNPLLHRLRGRKVFRVGEQTVQQRGIGCGEPAALRGRGKTLQHRRKTLRGLRAERGAVKLRPAEPFQKRPGRQSFRHIFSELFLRKTHSSRSLLFLYILYYNEQSGAVQQKLRFSAVLCRCLLRGGPPERPVFVSQRRERTATISSSSISPFSSKPKRW